MTPEEKDERLLAIEEARLVIEKERFAIEQKKANTEQNFWHSFSTPLVTILAAIVAGIFALAQVMVTSYQTNNQRESEYQRAVHALELENQRASDELDRRWQLDLSKFVLENSEVLLSNDETKQRKALKVLSLSFPAVISEQFLENLSKVSPVAKQDLIAQTEQTIKTLRRIGEPGPNDWVKLYQHDSFKGRVLYFSASGDMSVSDLKRNKKYDFGDAISSIEWNIESECQFEVYEHDSFRKIIRTLKGKGKIANLKSDGDKISSVRWVCK